MEVLMSVLLAPVRCCVGQRGSPVVRARCGGLYDQRVTAPARWGGTKPKWKPKHKNEMQVKRHNDDDGTLTIEVLDHEESGRLTFVGSAKLLLAKYMGSPGTKFEEQLELFGDPTPFALKGELVGSLFVTVTWVPGGDAAADSPPDGDLFVTALRAEGLVYPRKVIKDLTTYIDRRPIYMSLLAMVMYMLVSFIFYTEYMAAPLGADLVCDDGVCIDLNKDLLDRVSGGNGDWDGLNTLVFLFTTFTTIGYGNQPSLVATDPPCQYPSAETTTDAPYSVLAPTQMHGTGWVSAAKMVANEGGDAGSGFKPLDVACFEEGLIPSHCWVIADDSTVFDFTENLLYIVGDDSPPRNFTDEWDDLSHMEVPGELGDYNCTKTDPGNSTRGPDDVFACYQSYVLKCDSQLSVWRKMEQKKNVAKVFTIVAIVIGIAILGIISGVFGELLMAMVDRYTTYVELFVDAVTMDTADKLDPTDGVAKGVTIAFVGLGVVLVIGTLMFGWLESMKWVDAAYFTVVTATTVGFGDYCPNSFGGKVFTLFYAPLAVVFTAGAINHVAGIPLEKRKSKLEDYVLDQFGDKISANDFHDVRRSAGLKEGEDIRSNDFLLAMLLRLGTISEDDMVKARRLFSKLDMNGSGTLRAVDIEKLMIEGVETRGLSDKVYNPHASKMSPRSAGFSSPYRDQPNDEDSMVNPLAVKKGGMSLGAMAGAAGDSQDMSSTVEV